MSLQDKRDIFGLFQLLETFREMDPKMQMDVASIFLLIAMKPGIGQGELKSLMAISQAGVSRKVMDLTDITRHGTPGLDLVEQRATPHDARTATLHLTSRGDAFLDQVLQAWRLDCSMTLNGQAISQS